MPKPLNQKEVEILEERGLWKASSFLTKLVRRLTKKNLPLGIGYIKEAHKILFEEANQFGIAGKYRKNNGPELKRWDGTVLPMTDWHYIPEKMAELNADLGAESINLKKPKNQKEYKRIIFIAMRLSHRLACIHPFENGNGRASRLLMNAILQRAGLPGSTKR